MIVTGAGGLVGGAIATRLHADGVRVVGIVRAPPPTAAFDWRLVDLEVSSLADAVAELTASAIVHCAAVVPAPPQRLDDEENAASTRRIDAAAVAACASLGCRLIYVSSCILYDPADPAIKDERTLVRATTPYAAAKLDGEAHAAALDGSIVLRIPSPVGGSGPGTTVLDRFVRLALDGQPLEVWGSGRREQDFIHVTDIAEFIARALTSRASGVFNVASGRPITMRGLADTIVDVTGRGSVVPVGRPDPQDAHTARYDIRAARRMMDWAPRTDIREMIEERAARIG